jgi:hypothetical protein
LFAPLPIQKSSDSPLVARFEAEFGVRECGTISESEMRHKLLDILLKGRCGGMIKQIPF